GQARAIVHPEIAGDPSDRSVSCFHEKRKRSRQKAEQPHGEAVHQSRSSQSAGRFCVRNCVRNKAIERLRRICLRRNTLLLTDSLSQASFSSTGTLCDRSSSLSPS